MNRRHFISRSSLGILAAAGLPKAILNKSTESTSIYKTVLETGITNQLYYELIIDHGAVWYFDATKDQQNVVTLKVAYFETADLSNPTKAAEFTYIIMETSSINKTDDLWEIKTKFDKKVKGDYKFPKDFPKDMTLRGKPFSYFAIIGKKEQILVNIPYPSAGTNLDDDGCFLTTACVDHKQLADDCDELNTLRFLRDNFMKQNAEGLQLADNYKVIGPKIVKAISGFDNKAEIYNYMYDHLVSPSVKLIKAEHYAEATAYYKDFVEGLIKKYL